MIPTNKNMAVLHPYLDKRGGASSMMIYLSSVLSKNNNVKIYSFSRNKSKLFSFIKIAYAASKNDYVFIGNSPMHFVGVISKLFFNRKIKLIWWHHHYPWYYSQKANTYIKLKKILEKCFIKNIDSVIVNSKYLQDSIKEIYKIDSKILYPVLDIKFLNHNSENKKTQPHTIFTYGRRVEGKNLEMIFKTYEELKNKISDLVLIVGGEGEEILKYKNKYKCEESVKILGFINKEQIINNLEKSSLSLFPSKIDSFGLVILESMSIGNPVISYNVAGAKEIIKNDVNGYLVDSDSEFIDRSYEVLNNFTLRNNLSEEALKTSKTFGNYNFNKQLSKIF